DDPSGLHPEKSIPHDLICLCTVGGAGAPFNIGGETLCGKGPDELGCEKCKPASGSRGGSGKGWDAVEDGKDQLEKTWKNVVLPCLVGGNEGNLKAALETFTRHLNDRKQLGEQGSDCGGYNTVNICVSYANCEGTNGYPVWWKELEKAFVAEAAAAPSLEGSTPGSSAGRKGTETNGDNARRSKDGKYHYGGGIDQGSTTKNSPEVHPQPPIASESSKHSRGTSNGEGGNFGFFRLIGTFKLSQLSWFLFSGLL
ncbi:Variant surface glycoprotein, partial [Trypanosoma congolense IL3000]